MSLTILLRRHQIQPVVGVTRKIQQFHTSRTANAPPDPAWNDNEDFFRFTRSRFLCDEAAELSRRYVKFDVEQLAKISAEVSGPGTRRYVKVEKLADGLYNKALLLTMDDGIQVIGKVPNPNAGMPHFTTASEVATMDFARNILGTPAPKVLGWSSRTDNPVGVEYVIMEKMPGVQLETLWNKLDVEVKYGGLYYKQDLSNATSLVYTNKDGEQVTDDRFAVGPSTSRQNTDDGRMDVSFDRGPWTNAKDYAKAAGYREMACIAQISQLPKSPIGLYGPQTYRPSKEKKIKALQAYMEIVEHLLPGDKSIQTSHLWHNDLHAENIFVNPENPSEICGLIDWQTTELAPLYDHTIEPYFLDYQGPRMNGGLLTRPDLEEVQKLFEDDTELTPAEKKRKAESLFWRMALVSLWRYTIHMGIEPLFRALEFRGTVNFTLLVFARNLFLNGEAAYLAILAEQYRNNWLDIPGMRSSSNKGFPYEFTPEELKDIDFDCEGATNGINIMQDVKEAVGSHFFRVDGTVDHEDYEVAKEYIRLTKGDFMSKYPESDEERREWEAAWPFDD
ncbi:phosphotransferase family protein [Arthroderma uncinatum]|uniref:phosphotransferase family protein n=1 Tax=Arthroderma uncinatum TaxID=74035 RepID=UPI00144AC941|nr:phosphotransferase family protein [Arthroderma uncinatum]KAF3480542.1 phosphotransferase family protein [Arthroderma uncinatum]